MAYGDDLASPVQRRVAFAVVFALIELAYGWLVAGMMAAAPNPRLTTTSMALSLIVIASGVLMFGRARPASNWLCVLSPASIMLMVAGPVALAFIAIAHEGS